ncbi:SDR family NAD(P)-dependent oxidoreductase [Paracoccus yeei]|nr:SDR family oxidoreductase [Paracoccus yeei]MBY0138099.1 SDR family oxidoreductase [Paracoccus yeei]
MLRYPQKGAVVVTGAAQGIGRRLALSLVAEGVDVLIADWNTEKGKAVAAEDTPGTGRRLYVQTDVSDEASCRRAVEAATDVFGGVFGLVNNASIFSTLQMRPFWEIPAEEWDRVQAVNLKGVFNMTRAARAALVASGEGSVVNVASSTILFGRPNYAHYVSSKAGVLGLSRALAREMGADNVRVNTLTPGPTFTEVERATVTPQQKAAMIEQQCLKRPGGPDDIADPILFLLSRQARWVTGQLLNADGGMITH